MMKPKALMFLAFLVLFTSVGYTSSPTLNEKDYFLVYTPADYTVEIGKALNFKMDNAHVYLEHDPQTGQDYVGGLTVYGKDYLTGRGIRVGDFIDKVREYYGEPSRSGAKIEYKWLSYFDKQAALKIHFYLDKKTEKVIAINLNIYPVGAPPMIRLADGECH